MAEMIQMDEKTWRIEDGFVRFFILAGKERAAMIDSGFACPNAKAIAEELTGLPVILLNTHGDGDHTSGTGAFAEIHMSRADYECCGIAEKYPGTKLCAVGDGVKVSLGERTLEIIDIPGHTKGSIAILDVERRMLYAGDSVQTGTIFMFGASRTKEQYPLSLEKLVGLSDRYDSVVASHSEPVLQKEQVSKVLAAWKRVQRGEVPFETVNMHGTEVKQYQTADCGFYC